MEDLEDTTDSVEGFLLTSGLLDASDGDSDGLLGGSCGIWADGLRGGRDGTAFLAGLPGSDGGGASLPLPFTPLHAG